MDSLLIGLKEHENEEVARWQAARGGRAWGAVSGLAGLRVFEEFQPEVVAIATILPDIDSVRLARILLASRPDLRLVFVGAHHFEAGYFSRIEGLEKARYAHRPLHPGEDLGLPAAPLPSDGGPDDGPVSSESLSALFGRWLVTQETGAVYAGSGAARRVVYFNDGRPCYATSMIAAETLGHMLLAAGRISRVEFDWARNLQAVQGVLQGEALTKIGVLSEAELDAALREQILRKIVAMFTMTGETWHAERWDRRLRALPDLGFNAFEVLIAAADAAGPSFEGDVVRLAPSLSESVLDEARSALGETAMSALASGCSIATLSAVLGTRDRAMACATALRGAGFLA